MRSLFGFLLALIASLCIQWTTVDAKIFTRCQIAKELHKNQFPRTFISNWVCLIEAESGGDTAKVTEFPNLSSSYGIFQINSKEWCRKGRKGGECGARCEDFLDEDIRDDIRCAKIIYNRSGFNGWKGWQNRCKARPLPDISRCFEHRRRRDLDEMQEEI